MPAQIRHLLGVLSLLLFLIACRNPEPVVVAPTLPTSTPEPEQVTLTWSYWGDPWEVAINQQVVAVFEEDNPHLKVKMVHLPYNDYFKAMRDKFDLGEAVPDILFWSEAPNDVPKGYFLDLTSIIEQENYPLEDFFPGLLTHFRYGSGIYGLPRDSDTKVIFYNKRLFNQAGLPYPEPGWSWEDLRRISLALKQAEVADYSFAYEVNNWWMLWMWQNGVQVVDDKLFPTMTDLGQPAAAEAVQFLADLTNVDQVTPPYDTLTNSAEIAALFKEGKLAMAFGNHALVPAFAQVQDLEWDIVGLPQHKRQANVAAGAGYVIAANTAHPQEAWTFLKFLAGTKGQAIFAESGVVVPARKSVAQSDVFMQQQPAHKAQVFLDETEIGEATFAFPGAREIVYLVDEALLPVWQGQQDAASALEAVLPQVEAIVAKAAGQSRAGD